MHDRWVALLVVAFVSVVGATPAAQPGPVPDGDGPTALSSAAVRDAREEGARDASSVRTDHRPRPNVLRDVVSDSGRLLTVPDTYLVLGVGLAGSLAAMPLDDDIRDSSFNTEIPRYEERAIGDIFDPGREIGGGFFRYGTAALTYGVGRWLERPNTEELGRDLVRAQLLTEGVTQILKHTIRRTRPDGSNPFSYPSGHTSGTFATATVLRRHLGWKVGGPAYAVASYVAASRLTHNRHYLSDVIFGAAVGIAAAHAVTLERGDTRFEMAPVATPGGAAFQVSFVRRR